MRHGSWRGLSRVTPALIFAVLLLGVTPEPMLSAPSASERPDNHIRGELRSVPVWAQSTPKPTDSSTDAREVPTLANHAPDALPLRLLPKVTATSVSPVANFPGIPDTGADPSDGGLAVGPNHLVQVVNSHVAVFSKTGQRLSLMSLTEFMAIPRSDIVTDPRVLFDHFTGRWVVVVVNIDLTLNESTAYYAVSRSSDPQQRFCVWFSRHSDIGGVPNQVLADFPTLGVDERAYYVTLRRFSYVTGLAVDNRIIMLPKSALLNCRSSGDEWIWTTDERFPDGSRAHVLQPAITFGNPGIEYFVGSAPNGGSYVGIWELSGLVTDPMMKKLRPAFVGSYQPPPKALQRESFLLLSTLDARMPAAPVYRNGSLWFGFGVQSPVATPAVAWFELSAATGSVVQQDLLYFDRGGYSYPALMVDVAGNMAMVMTVNGANYYPDAAITTRAAADPKNKVSQPSIFTNGIAPYERSSSGSPVRWGDYFGAALDPDGKRIWFAATYPVSRFAWATAIVAITAGPSVVPARYKVSISPGTAPPARATVSVTAQLVAASGEPVGLAGRVVTWFRSATDGFFSSTTSVTNESGTASVLFTTGRTPGITYVITATDDKGTTGSSPQFTTVAAIPTPTPAARTLYLPNITKTLGGPLGWYTPFIVQNVGSVDSDLTVSFYRFSDGTQVAQRIVRGLKPGTSFADVPNNDADLPHNSQFSVVVQSSAAPIVAVVNEHQGTGKRAEAASYVGLGAGANTVYLPWVGKFANGLLMTLVLQNLGSAPATVTGRFVSFDGGLSATLVRTIAPGRSAFIDPSVESALITGVEYTVTLSATQPIAVVVNGHADAPGVPNPRVFSYNGITQLSQQAYVPLFSSSRSIDRPGGRLVLQNPAAAAARPTLTFYPLDGSSPITLSPSSPVPAGGAWAFDPWRGIDGGECPREGGPGCLREGEFAAVITGGQFAVVSAEISWTTAMGFSSPAIGSRIFLPNVTRTLGGTNGWSTPLLVQSAGATSVTLRWYRFADGQLVTSQTFGGVSPGRSIRVDPRTVTGLVDNMQYAVVVDASGPIAAIVTELNFEGGDGAMIYEGFVGGT